MSSLECANTNALNQYMNSIEEVERKREQFLKSIDRDIAYLYSEIKSLKEYASNFDGFDFTEDLIEEIGSIL